MCLIYFPTRAHNRAVAAIRAPDSSKGFYTTTEAARLARVPIRRLYAWKREGIVMPTLEVRRLDGRESVGYTFEGLVYLRVVRMLRDYASLEKSVIAATHLHERCGPPGPKWADARIKREGGELLVLIGDEWKGTVATRRGQKVMPEILFGETFEQLQRRADALLIPAEYQPFVEINPSIRSGHPVLCGTSLESIVLYKMRHRGKTYTEIAKEYPFVTARQIKGAVAFENELTAAAA